MKVVLHCCEVRLVLGSEVGAGSYLGTDALEREDARSTHTRQGGGRAQKEPAQRGRQRDQRCNSGNNQTHVADVGAVRRRRLLGRRSNRLRRLREAVLRRSNLTDRGVMPLVRSLNTEHRPRQCRLRARHLQVGASTLRLDRLDTHLRQLESRCGVRALTFRRRQTCLSGLQPFHRSRRRIQPGSIRSAANARGCVNRAHTAGDIAARTLLSSTNLLQLSEGSLNIRVNLERRVHVTQGARVSFRLRHVTVPLRLIKRQLSDNRPGGGWRFSRQNRPPTGQYSSVEASPGVTGSSSSGLKYR